MKTLQNNFTTPEQSKRLLELGVPADSADCYLQYDNFQDFYRMQLFEEGYEKSSQMHMHKNDLPCWSVGRLIEILSKCMPSEIYTPKFRCDTDVMKEVLDAIELELKYGLDFSKLEE